MFENDNTVEVGVDEELVGSLKVIKCWVQIEVGPGPPFSITNGQHVLNNHAYNISARFLSDANICIMF